jgi:hypothetical protein
VGGGACIRAGVMLFALSTSKTESQINFFSLKHFVTAMENEVIQEAIPEIFAAFLL